MKPDPLNWHPEIIGWSSDILPFYARVAEELPDPCRIVEVGVYRGRSVLFLADYLKAIGKEATIFAVDLWDESDEASHRPGQAEYESFIADRDRLSLSVTPIRASSRHVSESIVDAAIDLVFVDAAHTYEDGIADIDLWTPKIRPGGVLAGHDYSGSFPGLVRAVDERFAGRAVIADTVWSVRL